MERNDKKKSQYQHEQFVAEAGRDPFEQDNEFSREVSALPKNTDQKYEEEYAAELAAPATFRPQDRQVLSNRDLREREEEAEQRAKSTSTLGWISLALGIAALFFWQTMLGPAAILTGISAWIRGSRALGGWAAFLGVVALAAYFILVPYYS